MEEWKKIWKKLVFLEDLEDVWKKFGRKIFNIKS
jgi:hypothetical protein